ncbi:MAG: hypothetical protein KIS86_07975 [Devosia sp.]|nr:hypothetical protein [Devosia sp.]
MIRPLWPLLAGFSLWALAFIGLYAVQALGCVWSWPEGPHRGALVTIWLATLVVLGALLVFQARKRGPGKTPASMMGIAATIAAIAATIVTFFPVLFSSLCL